jgi:hypothetical protein
MLAGFIPEATKETRVLVQETQAIEPKRTVS